MNFISFFLFRNPNTFTNEEKRLQMTSSKVHWNDLCWFHNWVAHGNPTVNKNLLQVIEKYKREIKGVSNTHFEGTRRQTDEKSRRKQESWKWSFSWKRRWESYADKHGDIQSYLFFLHNFWQSPCHWFLIPFLLVLIHVTHCHPLRSIQLTFFFLIFFWG